MSAATAEHVATLRPRRSRNIPRIDVAVKCSCGAEARLLVHGCDGSTCPGKTHVRGGRAKPGANGETCPAVAYVIRVCDDSLSRAQVESIAKNGPSPGGV